MMDLQISKLRPNRVNQERERLYDDVLKQRMTTNVYKEENTRLKTRLLFIENDIAKKDRLIDELMAAQEASFGTRPKLAVRAAKNETHLVINLKRKIRDINNEKQMLMAENEALRRNIRISKMGELEVEMKVYIEECARLRHQLEEVIKSKDTFADPQELKVIEAKFQQKDVLIKQMQAERMAVSEAISKKDEENRQLAELVQEMERRMKKAQAANKSATKAKKDKSALE